MREQTTRFILTSLWLLSGCASVEPAVNEECKTIESDQEKFVRTCISNVFGTEVLSFGPKYDLENSIVREVRSTKVPSRPIEEPIIFFAICTTPECNISNEEFVSLATKDEKELWLFDEFFPDIQSVIDDRFLQCGPGERAIAIDVFDQESEKLFFVNSGNPKFDIGVLVPSLKIS